MTNAVLDHQLYLEQPQGYKKEEILSRTIIRRTKDGHLIYLADARRAQEDERGPRGNYILIVVDGKVEDEFTWDRDVRFEFRTAFRKIADRDPAPMLEDVLDELYRI